jgi:hypothetical protein
MAWIIVSLIVWHYEGCREDSNANVAIAVAFTPFMLLVFIPTVFF